MQNDDGGLQSAAPATTHATKLLKTTQKYMQKYCACHTERLSTLYQTRETLKVPRVPSKTTLQPVWKHLKMREFCSFPQRHGDAT